MWAQTRQRDGFWSLPVHQGASISVSKTQELSPLHILTNLHLQLKSKETWKSWDTSKCHKNTRPHANGVIKHGQTLWLGASLPSLKQWNCIRKERVFALSCMKHLSITDMCTQNVYLNPFRAHIRDKQSQSQPSWHLGRQRVKASITFYKEITRRKKVLAAYRGQEGPAQCAGQEGRLSSSFLGLNLQSSLTVLRPLVHKPCYTVLISTLGFPGIRIRFRNRADKWHRSLKSQRFLSLTKTRLPEK